MINKPYKDAKGWLAEDKVPVFVMGADDELKGSAYVPGPGDRLSLHSACPEERAMFLVVLCGQLRTRHGAPA